MGPTTQHSVFISYRRADAGGWPGRLEADLIDRFGSGRVFRDVRIPAGVDFEEHIERVLDGCSVLIAVIGPDWMTLRAADGAARIDQPDDLLREELERALRRPDVTVIPVLVGGGVMPDAADLPASLRALTRRQAVVLTDHSWDYDMGNLVDRLCGLLGEKRRRRRDVDRPPRRSLVLLVTVSTVIALGTGMFTLRDTLFPGQSGSAEAALVDYRRSVGEICTDVNETDRAAAAIARRLKKRLGRVRTIRAQRNALLNAARRTSARSADDLAQFEGLSIPSPLNQRHRSTLAAWEANQDRVTEYQRRLDGAGSAAQLVASIRYLASIRPELARDGIDVRAGLVNLGGGKCKLDPRVVTDTITLPPLRRRPARSATSREPDRSPRQPGAPQGGNSRSSPPPQDVRPPAPDSADPPSDDPPSPEAGQPHDVTPARPSGGGVGEGGG